MGAAWSGTSLRVGPPLSNPVGQGLGMTMQLLAKFGASVGLLALAWVLVVMMFCLG
jgi:hypothetical protein